MARALGERGRGNEQTTEKERGEKNECEEGGRYGGRVKRSLLRSHKSSEARL